MLATCGNGREGVGKTGKGVGLGQIGRVVRLGKGFGVCVVLDLRISPQDRGRGNGGEGLATGGNCREGVGKTGKGVGLV